MENSTLCINYMSFFRLQIVLRYVTFPVNKQIIVESRVEGSIKMHNYK
jgi:hypothetical protein